MARGRPFAPQGRPALVNGAIGVLVGPAGHRSPWPAARVIANGRIIALDLIIDRQKLARIEIA